MIRSKPGCRGYISSQMLDIRVSPKYFVFLVFFVLCWRLDSSQMRDIVGQPNKTKQKTPEKKTKKNTKKNTTLRDMSQPEFPKNLLFLFFFVYFFDCFLFFLIAFCFFCFFEDP